MQWVEHVKAPVIGKKKKKKVGKDQNKGSVHLNKHIITNGNKRKIQTYIQHMS